MTSYFIWFSVFVSFLIRNSYSTKEDDRIDYLPGQPKAEFSQYAGYVHLDPPSKALFYYLTESPVNSSLKPLMLWQNGGPGCSSFGNGGFLEIGPFRVSHDRKSLYGNPFAWNNVANVLFVDSPAEVGFSSRNDTNGTGPGDKSTALDSYLFLQRWLERFPEYKGREFYISGESYAGHFAPQLADVILQKNKGNHTIINLKGIAIGNGLLESGAVFGNSIYHYLWSRMLFSDETYQQIKSTCNFSEVVLSTACQGVIQQVRQEIGEVAIFNIYAPTCPDILFRHPYATVDSVEFYDPCASLYVMDYLNMEDVQKALHARHVFWGPCKLLVNWQDSTINVLPLIRKLIAKNLSIWLYSGDTDGEVPITLTKYYLKSLGLPIKTPWRPWYTDRQVGGYVIEYDGLVFTSIRGAGHEVPIYQPGRALTMISAFLQNDLQLLPSSI